MTIQNYSEVKTELLSIEDCHALALEMNEEMDDELEILEAGRRARIEVLHAEALEINVKLPIKQEREMKFHSLPADVQAIAARVLGEKMLQVDEKKEPEKLAQEVKAAFVELYADESQ